MPSMTSHKSLMSHDRGLNSRATESTTQHSQPTKANYKFEEIAQILTFLLCVKGVVLCGGPLLGKVGFARLVLCGCGVLVHKGVHEAPEQYRVGSRGSVLPGRAIVMASPDWCALHVSAQSWADTACPQQEMGGKLATVHRDGASDKAYGCACPCPCGARERNARCNGRANRACA